MDTAAASIRHDARRLHLGISRFGILVGVLRCHHGIALCIAAVERYIVLWRLESTVLISNLPIDSILFANMVSVVSKDRKC